MQSLMQLKETLEFREIQNLDQILIFFYVERVYDSYSN